MTLEPIPFAALSRRLVRELAAAREGEAAEAHVLEVPARRLWRGAEGLDLSVRHHGRLAATPLGPAAGPHTQLAPNIVAGWLAGCRVIELKTVQVRDDLVIPRPCIDMATVGFNVEWSQELRLEQSAIEYVKAAMAIEMLACGRLFPLPESARPTVLDLSVGYDLAGIRSAPVQRFLDTMADATPIIEHLRAEIPRALGALRDLDFTPTIAGSVTLSTFHGCPPGEIEAIARWLMEARGLDVTIKLNPTLLGAARVRELLHDVLGFAELRVPESAFEADARWEDVAAIVTRLREDARALGRGFGVKLTNTLVVENHRRFFPPSEKVMYLSGPPLHVVACELLVRMREAFGAALPISFSAGIDKHNFPDAVALGLVPVTACSDLLQPGGQGRAATYLDELATRMRAAGAHDIPAFVRAFAGRGDLLDNARHHLAATLSDPRYTSIKNARPPRKLDRTLALFDCTSCDKCIPVCPNTAIMGLEVERGGRVTHQIGVLADACNDCGNCDVFCPEQGAPNLSKPRFHLTRAGYLEDAPRDGLFAARTETGLEAWGRVGGREVHVREGDGEAPPGRDPLAADLLALARAAIDGATWVHDGAARGGQ